MMHHESLEIKLKNHQIAFGFYELRCIAYNKKKTAYRRYRLRICVFKLDLSAYIAYTQYNVEMKWSLPKNNFNKLFESETGTNWTADSPIWQGKIILFTLAAFRNKRVFTEERRIIMHFKIPDPI